MESKRSIEITMRHIHHTSCLKRVARALAVASFIIMGTVAGTASPQPFLGHWVLQEPAGDTCFLVVKPHGTASVFWSGAVNHIEQGTWQIQDGKMAIAWDQGYHDILELNSDDSITRKTYPPGHPLDGPPTISVRGEKLDRSIVGSLTTDPGSRPSQSAGEDTPEPSASSANLPAPPDLGLLRSPYIGFWEIEQQGADFMGFRGVRDRFYLQLARNGTVTVSQRNWAAEFRGQTATWTSQSNDQVQIRWPSGHVDVLLRKADQSFELLSWEPEQNGAGRPNRTNAAKMVPAAQVRGLFQAAVTRRVTIEDFIGYWTEDDQRGTRQPHIEIERWGNAYRFENPDKPRSEREPGDWEMIGNGVVVTWSDGSRDAIELTPEGTFVQSRFAPDIPLTGAPLSRIPVRRITRDELATAEAQALARQRAEAETARQRELETRLRAEAEARRQAQLEAKRLAEEEIRQREIAAQRAREAEEAEKQRVAEAQARERAEAEARRLAEEEAIRRAAAERAAEERAAAEAEASRLAAAEAAEAERAEIAAQALAQAEAEARELAELSGNEEATTGPDEGIEQDDDLIDEEQARADALEAERRRAEAAEISRLRAEAEARRIAAAEAEAQRQAEAEEAARNRAEAEAIAIAQAEREAAIARSTEELRRAEAAAREQADRERVARRDAEARSRAPQFVGVQPTARKAPLMEDLIWALVWEERFTGSELNHDLWNIGYPNQTISNNELTGYIPEMVQVRDDTLVITARERSVQYAGKEQPYASGVITTFGKFDQAYGYFEIRARVTEGRGLWPNFWLVSRTGAAIRVMDVFGHEVDRIYHTVIGSDHDGRPTQQIGSDKGNDISWEYRTIGVMWTPSAIAFHIDGVETFRITENIPDSPMSLVISMAVGGEGAGPPDGWTPFPARFTVDGVRVFRLAR